MKWHRSFCQKEKQTDSLILIYMASAKALAIEFCLKNVFLSYKEKFYGNEMFA